MKPTAKLQILISIETSMRILSDFYAKNRLQSDPKAQILSKKNFTLTNFEKYVLSFGFELT